MNRTPEPNGKPSLEALLRVKRAERPDAGFWTEFERGMRQKQLAAIMEPKPWWLGLSILGRKYAPLAGGLAAGAAAVLFAMLLQSRSVDTTSAVVGSVPTERASGAKSADSMTVAGASTPVATAARANNRGNFASPGESTLRARALPAAAPVAVAAVESQRTDARVSPLPEAALFSGLDFAEFLKSTSHEVARLMTSPSGAEHGAASSALASMEWNLAASLGDAVPLASTLADSGGVVSDQASDFGAESETELPATNPRQARFLAGVSGADTASSLAHVRERVLHRMDDGAELYASISRLGVSGDRLSLKF